MNLFTQTIETHVESFINYLKTIVKDEYKNKIDENISLIKQNQAKFFLYIVFLNESNKKSEVDKLCRACMITEAEHIKKISDYYDLFLQLKSTIY